jgi:pimeloyl-ACP methyl ester carboxylesterase
VLVHGMVVSGASMVPLGRQLASRFQVWIPDLPGFGLSSRTPSALDVTQLAEALAAWIRRTGLTRKKGSREARPLVASPRGSRVAIEPSPPSDAGQVDRRPLDQGHGVFLV